MEKVDRERYILELATPLLSRLYGEFEIISEQLDRPDAAIIIKKSNIKIGIEITSIDKKKDQEYLNNKKIASEVKGQQVENLLSDGSYSSRPIKKVSISFPCDYIFEGVVKKVEKYRSYSESGEYGEMLVLAFSSYLSVDHETFNDYHKPWTNFLLSEQVFPFDKVIFVDERTRKAVVIYDKASPLQETPLVDSEKEAGITVVQGSILPVGKTVNMAGLFTEEPHVSPKKKSKKRRR